MPDWYRDHDLSPDAYPDSEYLDWAQDNGLYVDAAGNVNYGSRYADCYELTGEDITAVDDGWPELAAPIGGLVQAAQADISGLGVKEDPDD